MVHTISATSPKETNNDKEKELHSLKEELKETQNTFKAWKLRTKAGVDQLRSRIVDLTTRLEASESQKRAMAMSLQKLDFPKNSETAPMTRTLLDSSFNTLVLKHQSAVVEHLLIACGDKMHALWQAALSCSNDSTRNENNNTAPSTSEKELESYKRRVAVIMKLQQKNSEELQRQIVELQQRIQFAEKELQERTSALTGKEETVSLLEQRLTSVERVYEQLRFKQDTALCTASMDCISAMEEKMEQEISNLRAEFMSRENSLVMRHHDELEHVQSMYEREIRAILQESEEKLMHEIEQALSLQRHELLPSSSVSLVQDDVAYSKLLKEFEALEKENRDLVQENSCLKNELQKLAASKEDKKEDSNEVSEKFYSAGNPTSLVEAKEMIQKLQTSLTMVTEQLWNVKKALISAKQSKVPEGALDAQHATYLKSIVIKIFSICNNDPTISKLLPVIAVLLQFTVNDLETVYQSKPEWRHKN